MVDWPSLLSSHGVHYVTSGPNVSRGRIAVACPFCGLSDPSQHMTINLTTNYWRCWRSPHHRGSDPARLVSTLFHCSFERAQVLTQSVVVEISPDRLDQAILGLTPKLESTPFLSMPKEFKPITDRFFARPYINYLLGRGFSPPQVLTMTRDYNIYYCTDGPFTGRIIFLVYFEGQLVSWTGRTIDRRQELRYKSLDADTAGSPISNYLLWFDDLMRGGDTLVVVEGPFDALKLRVLGQKGGVLATCFFTSGPSRKQIDLLHSVAPRFRRRVLILDRGTWGHDLSVSSQLSSLDFEMLQLTTHKDPGELDISAFRQLFALDSQ